MTNPTPASVTSAVGDILQHHQEGVNQLKGDWDALMDEMDAHNPPIPGDTRVEVKQQARTWYVEQINKQRASYDARIAALRDRVYSQVQGYQPTDESSTLNRRDASRRARLLSSPEQAEQLLGDALFLHDDTLAHAVGHHAQAHGWTSVTQAYAHAHGDAANALQALSTVDNLHKDKSTKLLLSMMFSPTYFA